MENREQRKDEVFSMVVPAGKRRYFFDVKETRGGERYITITESRKLFDERTGRFSYEKNKLFLYKEDFEKFRQGLEGVLQYVETGIEPAPIEYDPVSWKEDAHSTTDFDTEFRF